MTSRGTDPDPLVLSYSIPQAAARSGWSLKELTAAISRGDLRARKATPESRYRRILHSDLIAWMDKLPDA